MDHVIDEWIDGWIKISICGSGKVFKAIITLGLLHVVFKVVQGVGLALLPNLALVAKPSPCCPA